MPKIRNFSDPVFEYYKSLYVIFFAEFWNFTGSQHLLPGVGRSEIDCFIIISGPQTNPPLTDITRAAGADCSYQMSLPLVLQSVERYPYRVLTVSGSLEPPKLQFSSQHLMLLPTPLSASIATSLQLIALNYTWSVAQIRSLFVALSVLLLTDSVCPFHCHCSSLLLHCNCSKNYQVIKFST